MSEEMYECAGCGGEVSVVDAVWLPEPKHMTAGVESARPFCCRPCYVNTLPKQSDPATELTTLRATVAGLEKERDGLREALQGLVDDDTTPEPNCSCHISPPCSDCVANSGRRELVAIARTALGGEVGKTKQ